MYLTPHHVKHQWRVFNVEQSGWVVRAANRCNGPVISSCQPVNRGLQQPGQLGRFYSDGAHQLATTQLVQGSWALPKHSFSRAESGQQLARGVVAHTGAQGQAQPGREFSALQSLGLAGCCCG